MSPSKSQIEILGRKNCYESFHETTCEPAEDDPSPKTLDLTTYCVSPPSLSWKCKMGAFIIKTSILLSCCQSCHGSNVLRPRLEGRIIYEDDSDSSIRKLMPEYKALIEDFPFVDETSMSMSLSFDISESVKSLSLGDKSLAAGELLWYCGHVVDITTLCSLITLVVLPLQYPSFSFIEFLDNLHNNSSLGSTPSPTFVPLLPFEFNSTCYDLGHAAAQSEWNIILRKYNVSPCS